MKIKVFLIAFLGASIMMLLSSALLYTQMRSIRSVNLDTLSDSLYQEDARILSLLLATVPAEKLETMKLPESWAEIFLTNAADLQVTASTNPSHRGLPLYRHPLLLDQASAIMKAIKTGAPSAVNTASYMVVVHPASTDQILIALKPKAWEKGLVLKQEQEIKAATKNITLLTAIFLAVGFFITLVVSFVIARVVVNPTRNIIDAMEALSLGNFEYELKEPSGKKMAVFAESYLRLKASLEIALEIITRR